ncbi:hypothetical protein AA101099_2479 [Neoasaia chiangmaiensis NBRC 101099]|uniref:SDR family NAD(P)-dependent oxidoreductase n=1 Tax=Neoasaia chiangmaiensis TaxID=320497 RepID=UPI001191E9E7|nr:SDR family NAD(P)-dependent oxidoreductase [Neoasaia chiangmaiensis]GBR41343.1 hypothetical protein AA101099_2479 [Neoasaia chiangmaiensis NBRC 101099]GEN16670.1 hypothetical protein NCH01_31010 [Neoasaia chiangmaiensis]
MVETFSGRVAFVTGAAAGTISPQNSTADLSEAEWDRIMSVNLRGTWYCMTHELRRMLAQECGAIVNASSTGRLNGIAGLPAYVASAVLWLCSPGSSFVPEHAPAVIPLQK